MQNTINISAQQEVQKMLNWSDMEYSTFQYETGMEYLHWYIPSDTKSIALLERSRSFWAWWKKRWNDRDIEFINNIQDIRSIHRESIYIAHHSPCLLSHRIYPSKVIWQQALKVKA